MSGTICGATTEVENATFFKNPFHSPFEEIKGEEDWSSTVNV